MGVVFVGRTPVEGFRVGVSSPKRNRLDQCLLGLEESQKLVIFVGVFRVKALIIKALSVSYVASQALMPKRCKILLEALKELPPFGRMKMKDRRLCHDQRVSAPLVNSVRLLCKVPVRSIGE
ncbi:MULTISPECIES: hypothetical protein [unclassified Pseudomonas]|uniref:hypothetical protein n=1 Tax=unclassified Pseudomonas TaxID=196821 RepID=UPI0018E90459|nr:MULTISPECIES: hypothetical protein [unclassified Pseudomonas]MBJ2224897.1 hypothetical protein [Pseudomonas sp. MF7451]